MKTKLLLLPTCRRTRSQRKWFLPMVSTGFSLSIPFPQSSSSTAKGKLLFVLMDSSQILSNGIFPQQCGTPSTKRIRDRKTKSRRQVRAVAVHDIHEIRHFRNVSTNET